MKGKMKIRLTYRKKLIAKDGGTLAMDWVVSELKFLDVTPICFIYPGVTGHSQCSYVKEMATHMTERGYRVVSLNQRGINCELTSPKISCGAFTGDIEEIINHIRSLYPNAPLYGISYSMGANLLTKYIGQSKTTDLQGIVSISNPLDFVKSNVMFSHFWAKHLYSSHLCRGALKMIEGHRETIEKLDILKYDDIMKSKTLYALDTSLTAKVYGYGSAQEYYEDACSGEYIHQIQIPTLIINALDDPFVHESVLNHSNPNIIMALTNRGGHLGFSSGILPWNVENWTIEVVSEYLDALQGTRLIKK